jgi:hypothetical protein
MWRHVCLIRTDISEERVASIFRVERIREVGTTLAVSSRLAIPSSRIVSTVKIEATLSSETSVLTRPARCHTPEDGILLNNFRENLKLYRHNGFIPRTELNECHFYLLEHSRKCAFSFAYISYSLRIAFQLIAPVLQFALNTASYRRSAVCWLRGWLKKCPHVVELVR